MNLLTSWGSFFESRSERCLVCNSQIESSFGWSDILFDKATTTLCSKCENKLSVISGETCLLCGRELSQLDVEYFHDGVCLDCIRWQESAQQFLDRNSSLFNYNDFMKDIITRMKYRGDYKLIFLFESFLQGRVEFFKKESFIIIPIPLSEERHLERGFNQAEAFGEICGFHMKKALKRIHSEKQSKRSRSERLKSEQVFRLDTQDVSGKKILLLDDIYTTGTTLQHAAQVLKVYGGAKEVQSLTIARS